NSSGGVLMPARRRGKEAGRVRENVTQTAPSSTRARLRLRARRRAFFDGDVLVGAHVLQRARLAARPLHFQLVRLLTRAEAEEQAHIGGREVARPAEQVFASARAARADGDARADAVAIALRADEADAEPVITIAVVVPEEH